MDLWIQIGAATGALLLIIVPPILILLSGRTEGGTKIGWLLATFFFSFLGYIAFLIFTKPVPKAED